MHLLTATKKSFSAVELQGQLGHKRYQSIWEMLHKLRSVMNLRDAKYDLFGTVELTRAFSPRPLRGKRKKKRVTNATGGTLVKGYLTGYCWLHLQVGQALNTEYINETFADIHKVIIVTKSWPFQQLCKSEYTKIPDGSTRPC
jgi:hypothetical protein